MDEHDKRAREVVQPAAEGAGIGPAVTEGLARTIATALRETAQAARDAERERCARVCDDIAKGTHASTPFGAATMALKSAAQHIRSTGADPAQAARDRFTALVEAAGDLPACERCGRVVLAGPCCADPVASERDYLHRVVLLARAEPDLPMESVVFQAGQPGREIGPAADPVAAERARPAPHAGLNDDELVRRVMLIRDANVRPSGEVIDAFDALISRVGTYREQMRNVRARIAARLLARADEEDDEALADAKRRAHSFAAQHLYAAAVLRAEAAALTEGDMRMRR